MGIRVHKSVGYGVTDLKHTRRQRKPRHRYPRMTDPRVDWDRLYHYDTEEHRYDTDFATFVAWMRDHQEEITRLHAREWPGIEYSDGLFFDFEVRMLEQAVKEKDKRRLPRPSRCVIHDIEFGIPRVLQAIPIQSFPEWHRYDDTIDWIEESDRYRQLNRVRRLKRTGIYPYDNWMIRFRDPPESLQAPPFRGSIEGVKADDKGLVCLSGGLYNQIVGRWDSNIPPLVEGEALDHFRNDWRPQVPLTVIAVLLWYDCFPDLPAFIDCLRPILYVRWG